jgi:hypothetical protein
VRVLNHLNEEFSRPKELEHFAHSAAHGCTAMDATYFLKRRTALIRFLYAESVKPFEDIKSRIENSESPYDNPPYSEDPEPPFLREWMDAETAKDLLGLSAVSLLSDTLKLYFQTLRERVIGFEFGEEKALTKRQGFVAAYIGVLGHILDTDWSDCPVRLDVIEQVVLARNRGQHGTNLTSLDVRHDNRTLTKRSKPFFASEAEWQTWQAAGENPDSFFAPSLQVTQERLMLAIDEVEKLADWVDGRLPKAYEWRAKAVATKS